MENDIKAKLVILGATGDGKSSLGNFILNQKDLFKVSGDPESETKETIGNSGINGAENIFVIDTPGLHDTRESDKKHIIDMVQYVKQHPDIQAIIIVFNFNQDRFAPYLRTMIKIFNDIYSDDKFWFHVGFVFTKYYKDMRRKFEPKKEKKIEQYIGKIKELVKECRREAPQTFKTFFIDSDMDDIDENSVEECKNLIGWVASLDPIDVSKVQEVDDKIQKSEIDEWEIEGPSRWERNIEFKTFIKLERIRNYHYDGSITYTEEKEIDRREEKIEHEKELVNSRFEEKEEIQPSTWEGKKEIITTKFLRRKILTYNDGSVEEGSWEEYKSPEQKVIEHPKELKDVKDNYKTFDKDGKRITQQQKIRIFDDGSTEEGEWETISELDIPKNEERKIVDVREEEKVEYRKELDFKTESKSYETGWWLFKKTHYYETSTPITKEVKIKMKRTVTYYSNGDINHGDWRQVE